MKTNPLTRRTFVKKASAGAAGVALTSAGMASFYPGIMQDIEKPAILGGKPVRPEGSPLGVSWPIYEDSDIQMYLDAYKSKRWSEYRNSDDELSVKFEKEFAELMGVSYCAATNSGTDALEAAQRAYDIHLLLLHRLYSICLHYQCLLIQILRHL
jgi:hypothetical protein